MKQTLPLAVCVMVSCALCVVLDAELHRTAKATLHRTGGMANCPTHQSGWSAATAVRRLLLRGGGLAEGNAQDAPACEDPDDPFRRLMQKTMELHNLLERDGIEGRGMVPPEEAGEEALKYLQERVEPLLANAAKEIIKTNPLPSDPAAWLAKWFDKVDWEMGKFAKIERRGAPRKGELV